MKLYKYYYGICEHRICVQSIETNIRNTEVIYDDGFLYLKSRDDHLAKQLFAEDEARKANAKENEELALKHRKRIHAILNNPVLEIKNPKNIPKQSRISVSEYLRKKGIE